MIDLRVLIADDDESVLGLIAKTIEQEGNVSCVKASSCRNAIAVYGQDPRYHLVLSDLNQDPSGVDLADFVRQNCNGIPTRVGIMTGGAPQDLTDRAKIVSDYFFGKPFSIDKLKDVVKETRLYFERVGIQGFPSNWYVDNSCENVFILAVQGRGDLNSAMDRFQEVNKLKVGWKDVDGVKEGHLLNNPGVLWNAAIYPACPDDENPNDFVVFTGIGNDVVDLMRSFLSSADFQVQQPSVDFVSRIEKELLYLKNVYLSL